MPLSVQTTARAVFSPLLDYLFPRTCLNCQQLLPDDNQYVCTGCWSSIERLHARHSLFRETREKLQATKSVTKLVSCFVFQSEGAFQSLAHAMKYDRFQQLGVWLGRSLGEELQKQKIQADYLIPVPLHKRKLRERGYNQAELIARGISEVTHIPMRADMVQRWRFTETQTKLNIDERRKNMEDAFEVLPASAQLVNGKTFIVVDDVITTGATINSCAGELKTAGAKSVIAASLALAE